MEEEKITIGKDGNQWFVLWGKDLHDGVAGFGNSINEAMIDFAYSIIKESSKWVSIINKKDVVINEKYYKQLYSKAEKFDTLKQLLKGILDL